MKRTEFHLKFARRKVGFFVPPIFIAYFICKEFVSRFHRQISQQKCLEVWNFNNFFVATVFFNVLQLLQNTRLQVNSEGALKKVQRVCEAQSFWKKSKISMILSKLCIFCLTILNMCMTNGQSFFWTDFNFNLTFTIFINSNHF